MASPEPAPTVTSLRRFILPFIFVAALFIVLFLRRPVEAPGGEDVWEIHGETMGTTYAIKVIPEPETPEAMAQEVAAAVEKAVGRVNAGLSTYSKTSELSLFNGSSTLEPQDISQDFERVLRAGLKIYAMSGGAFDVTVGPLVNLWGFGPDKDRSPPSPDDLLRARKRVGSNLLVLNTTAGTLGKKIPDVYVDLSAIAKGYGVDEMAAALEKEGYSRYLVELGGEIRSRGAGVDGRPWQVGLETPDGGVQDVESRVQMEGESLATSGNYRNFRLVDGKRISHTMDPRSGAPVDHSLASVSVIAETCMMADGWATAMMVLGVVGGLKIADAEGLAVRFLVAEPTPGTFRVVRSRAWDTWVEKSPVLPKENSARGKDSVVDPKTE